MGSPDKNLSNLAFTKTALAVLMGITFLAVDAINPIKMFLHTFPSVEPWHIATVCMLLALYIFISELKALLYFAVKIFFHSVLSIFFRDVEIIGRDKLPRHGPMIFSVNHANQFMDAVTLLCTCDHSVSYLMAEASWKRRIVGDIAWALDVVPVKRAQDSAKQGKGKVQFEGKDDYATTHLLTVQGTSGTIFTKELAKGDKIRPTGTAAGVKIVELVDDTTMLVDGTDIPEKDLGIFFDRTEPNTYDLLKRVDQKVVYEKVLDKLAGRGCVGIFPEGGSHDRTDLLPLKVGVALIAYSALEKDGLSVPIVPVGLNYFRSHRWRGRAVVEYGHPIYIDPSTLNAYKAGGQEKRQVCSDLLDRIQDSMRSVIVSTPDYESLQLIHTARRLFQRKDLQADEKQDMTRRFAEGYKMLTLMTKGDPPEDWMNLQKRVKDYQVELRELGIRDYQVTGLYAETREDDPIMDQIMKSMRLAYQMVHLLIVLALAAIPGLFLNLPVGVLAGLYSERRRQKALAKSKVKIKAYDVMLTEKVIFCMIAIPTLWTSYGLALYFFTEMDGPTISLCILSMPLFAYVGIIVSEAGMVDIKDMWPYFMRMFPSSRRRLRALPATRAQLQIDLRVFIKKVGPALGEIYHGKDLDWTAIQQKTRTSGMLNPDVKKGQ